MEINVYSYMKQRDAVKTKYEGERSKIAKRNDVTPIEKSQLTKHSYAQQRQDLLSLDNAWDYSLGEMRKDLTKQMSKYAKPSGESYNHGLINATEWVNAGLPVQQLMDRVREALINATVGERKGILDVVKDKINSYDKSNVITAGEVFKAQQEIQMMVNQHNSGAPADLLSNLENLDHVVAEIAEVRGAYNNPSNLDSMTMNVELNR